MSHSHRPVLFDEVMKQAADTAADLGGLRIALDATFGRGGHTRGLLERFPDLTMVAVDQDPDAIAFGEREFAREIAAGRLRLLNVNFDQIEFSGGERFDFILFDLGVSSPQLDRAERGFSFYAKGPLDMRMDPRRSRSAADVVNGAPAQELSEIFKTLGEVERPDRVVRAIVEDRKSRLFTDTLALASLVERVDGWSKKGFHPATQYFMALRLYVNRELEAIESALPIAVARLTPGGRLAVITFHSLEDRIVKQYVRTVEGTLGESTPRRSIEPTFVEVQANSRARSARLRVFRRYGVGETKTPKNKYAHLVKNNERSESDRGDKE